MTARPRENGSSGDGSYWDTLLEHAYREPPTRGSEPRSGAAHAAAPIRAIGRLRIDGEIARGGVGVILRGFDPDIGRSVAVKVLHEAHAHDLVLVRRLVAEAQIAGQLRHPGIVPIHAFGLDDRDRPYIVMQLVRGRSLAAVLRDGRPATDEATRTAADVLATIESVCRTVGHAHSRGVVHRDLKPSNVMIGEHGEILVMDWGFARVLAHSPIETVWTAGAPPRGAGTAIVGTPAYVAPEQARGDSDVGPRADVFSLGAMLFEAIVGSPPYPIDGFRERGARTESHAALHRLAWRRPDPALAALTRRCLHVDPMRRPADGNALAEELSRCLARTGQQPRPARVRSGARAGRYKLVFAAGAAALILLPLLRPRSAVDATAATTGSGDSAAMAIDVISAAERVPARQRGPAPPPRRSRPRGHEHRHEPRHGRGAGERERNGRGRHGHRKRGGRPHAHGPRHSRVCRGRRGRR